MSFAIFAGLVLSLLVLLIVLLRIWLRRRFLTLRWPVLNTYFNFTKTVRRYLGEQGWDVKLGRVRNTSRVTRDKELIKISSHGSMEVFTETKIRDMVERGLKWQSGPRLLVCVTANAVPPHLVQMAASGGVLILHYTRLADFKWPGRGLGARFESERQILAEQFQALEKDLHARQAALRGEIELHPPEKMPSDTALPETGLAEPRVTQKPAPGRRPRRLG